MTLTPGGEGFRMGLREGAFLLALGVKLQY